MSEFPVPPSPNAADDAAELEAAASNHPYSRLTPDCILAAVESQGYLCDARILPLNSYENRVYQVGIEGASPLIAKFYRPERWSEQQILEEHHFTLELAELEIPVVPPLVNSAGKSLFEFDNYRFALYPRQGGHAPELDQMDNLIVLGRFMGRVHAAGQQGQFTHRPLVDVQGYGIESVEFICNSGFLPFELESAYTSLCRDLLDRIEERFAATSYDNIKLHGDCHPGNILWRDDRPHFVDFDDARNGPAIQDLWMLLSGDRDAQSLQMTKLLEGYRQFYDFNTAELGLIEALRGLRIMHYAAWLARRWDDPAFPLNFPWFSSSRYWSDHILELREQLAALNEPPLRVSL